MNRSPALPFYRRDIFKVWNLAEKVGRKPVETPLRLDSTGDVLCEGQRSESAVTHPPPVDHVLQVQKQRLSLLCHLIFDASFDRSAPLFRPCKRSIFFTSFVSCFK
jgi:hypothetical protein